MHPGNAGVGEDPFPEIIGCASIKLLARCLAEQDLPVMIAGETGVGKNLFARAMHRCSRRAARRLVTVHCPTIQPSLFESELFGHCRGSFTDAHHERSGAIEYAEGGTLFFDEISEISVAAQAKLLRVVDERCYQKVGESRERQADVRFLFATNRDLGEMVRDGRFRKDLYFRISMHCLWIPPLRERREDIADLACYLWRRVASASGLEALARSELAVLMAYDYPGNVRELRGVLERLALRQGVDPTVERVRVLEHELDIADPEPGSKGQRRCPQRLLESMVVRGHSFWDVVHQPYLRRELNRYELKEILSGGLSLAGGGWKDLLPCFNIDQKDHKKFLDFVRKQGFRLDSLKQKLASTSASEGAAERTGTADMPLGPEVSAALEADR